MESSYTAIPIPLQELYKEKEGKMASNDKLISDTEEAKNALEEYCYEMRAKIQSQYAVFIDPSLKDRFLEDLSANEDWLYGEGEEAPKSAYVKRLDEIKKVGVPVAERYREAEMRLSAARDMQKTLDQVTEKAMSTDENYSHIPAHERQDVVDRVDRARRWLDEELVKQADIDEYRTPILFSSDIEKEKEAVLAFANPILNKPKPAPKPATPEQGGDTPMGESGEANEDASKDEEITADKVNDEDAAADKAKDMDID